MKRYARFFTRASVKEAFDNLPSGVCFFAASGVVILCNKQMYRLAFALTGRDLQYVDELRGALDELPESGAAVRDGDAIVLPDGTAWLFREQTVRDGEGCSYIEFVASDVTELHRTTKEMAQKNVELEKMAADREYVNRNVTAITREEELIAVKMRIHDEMGGSIAAARRFYIDGCQTSRKNELVRRWRKTVAKLEGDTGICDDGDTLAELLKTAEDIGARIELNGEMPQKQAEFLIVCAMRECLTNVMRHAGGNTLYVEVSRDSDYAAAVITNNGAPPAGTIVEGGGLGALRRRIEKAGGVMSVQSLPEYKLTITVPLKGDELA